MRLLCSAVLLILTTTASLAAEEKAINLEETQGYLQAYEALAKKYPNASQYFEIVDAKTRLQLPQCSGSQSACCIKTEQHPVRCVSWSCCDDIR